MPLFIIEHLEPEVYPWCLLEYKHISSWVGKEHVLFTKTEDKKLLPFGKLEKKSIHELTFENACVLDPEAPETLTPAIAKKYSTFIFGGILGDYPPRKRTQDEIKLPYPRYNLGKDQMSTDTAVIVTKLIIDGKKLTELQFQDGAEIEINDNEAVDLPYKYLVIDGKLLLAPGLAEMLKEQEEF